MKGNGLIDCDVDNDNCFAVNTRIILSRDKLKNIASFFLYKSKHRANYREIYNIIFS